MGIGTGTELAPDVGAVVARQEIFCDVVGWENRGCKAHVDGHIGNGRPGTHIEVFDAGTVKFHNFAGARLAGISPQQFKDEILAGNVGLKLAFDIDTPNLRGDNIIGLASQSHGHFDAACPHCQHTETTACGRVAIRSEQGLSGNPKSLSVDMMRDSVARRGKGNAEFGCAGLQEAVVIGVSGVGLDDIVIDVADCGRCFYLWEAHRFKFKVYRGSRGILRKNLINQQPDFIALAQLAIDQVLR